MLRFKVYRGPTGQFQWTAFDDELSIVANSPRTYDTERNLLTDLKVFIEAMRQPVTLIGYQIPIMAKRTPEL